MTKFVSLDLASDLAHARGNRHNEPVSGCSPLLVISSAVAAARLMDKIENNITVANDFYATMRR